MEWSIFARWNNRNEAHARTMAFKLPPLNTLRFFEASGRLLSFKLAADELDVTPSAVSHGIQSLEDWLGVSLFARTSRGLTLTDAGADYLPAVGEALRVLAVASDRIPGRPPRKSLAISVAPTFGARILLPRLSGFRNLHPEITVHIDTAHQRVEFPRDGVDLAIRMGDGKWSDLATIHLLTEELVPVCSPELLKKLGPEASLCEAPLIHVTTASQDWAAWAERAGREPVDCKRGLMVDTIQMAFEAAVQGLGIAIGRLPLAAPELESGSLVPFGDPSVVPGTGYWLVGAPDAMQRREIISFRDWLLDELSEFCSDPPPAETDLQVADETLRVAGRT
jgi:DNA-binding transcriptional LysR family regulator